MDAQTRFWMVVLGGVLAAWAVGEGLSLLLWTFMRDRAMLAARVAWFVAIVGAMAGVDGWLGLQAHSHVLMGEGVALAVVLLVFIVTYRRRPA